MRDLKNKSLRLRRYRRRLLLTIVLLSATPALAEKPAPADSSTGSSAAIQTNPFVSVADLLTANDIHLASGQNQSTIRLKPIGKAIGLKSLSTPAGESRLPQDVGRSKMTIESVPSLIQTNPLIDSSHRADRPLVDVDIMPAQAAADSDRSERRSTIMLMPSRNIPSVHKNTVPSVHKNTVPSVYKNTVPSVHKNTVPSVQTRAPEPAVVKMRSEEQPIMVPTVAAAPLQEKAVADLAATQSNQPQAAVQPEPTQVAINPPAPETDMAAEPEIHEPVRFSLSDRSRPADQLSDSSDRTESTVIEEEINGAETIAETEEAVASDPEPSAPSIVRAMPIVAESTEPIRFNTAPRSESSQSDSVRPSSPTFARSGVSIVSRRPNLPRQNKLAKRYRPPVEVKAVPLLIERTSTNEPSTASVEVVPAFAPGSVAMTGSNGVAPTILEMDLAQVRSLTLGGKLHAVKVADASVCKVVASGSHQLKLIGTGEGITQLIVLAEGTEKGKKPLQRTFQVHVTDSPQVAGHSLVETCELLNQSVQETFPGCEVLVLQRDKQLMVAGRCDSQASAKKIMRMVRRTCLIPVRDELIVE